MPLVAGAVILKVRACGVGLFETLATSTQATAPGGVVATRQPIEFTRLFALPFWLVTFTVALIVAPVETVVIAPPSTVALVIPDEAATYGPTNGPPLPTGAAPAGVTASVDVSANARARFSRPLPV